jgi:starvation-inducible DNA-binding protein
MSIHLDLDPRACQEVAQQLKTILADTYILYTKTQNFHWNLVDTRFYSLHKFLEDQYEKLAENIDEIAERIRMLGQKAPGSLRQFLELTSLEESTDALSADHMLTDLLSDHEQLGRQLRQAIPLAQKKGDEGTADLFIQSLRFHEKQAWMLRSHFLNEKT